MEVRVNTLSIHKWWLQGYVCVCHAHVIYLPAIGSLLRLGNLSPECGLLCEEN